MSVELGVSVEAEAVGAAASAVRRGHGRERPGTRHDMASASQADACPRVDSSCGGVQAR